MISDDGRSKKSENPFITFHHIGYIDQTRIQAPLRASWWRLCATQFNLKVPQAYICYIWYVPIKLDFWKKNMDLRALWKFLTQFIFGPISGERSPFAKITGTKCP